MGYIMAQNLTGLTAQDARDLVEEMQGIDLWSPTQEFVRGIRADVTAALPSQELDFTTLAKIVDVVGEEFGRFQNKECTSLKAALVKVENRGSGRVKLADFYKAGLQDAGQFQESVSYLRQLGALDESDAQHPSVIIPNYLQSESNCIAASGFYSVCCMDEGEGLLGHIEEKIGAPDATPTAIAAIVSSLPSSSVQAPRILPAALLKRLDEIAVMHSGRVPLHSRLFGQWMHHAFPREFPLPHMSGTTSQQSPEEWLSASGSEAAATEEEMSHFSNLMQPAEVESFGGGSETQELLPWSHAQELLIPRTPFGNPVHTGPSSSPLSKVMYLAAISSVAYGLAHTLKGSQGKQPGKKEMDNGKYFV
jgi:hypothetical protein